MENSIISDMGQILDRTLGKIQNDYLDIQGAFFLGISKSTIYKLNHREEIQYFTTKHSKKCCYLKEDLVKCMTENRFKSKQQIDDETQRFIF